MYANEFETKEKQKLPEIKNYLQHLHNSSYDMKAEYNNCFIIHSK